MAGVVDDGFIRAHGRVDAVCVGEESNSLGVELRIAYFRRSTKRESSYGIFITFDDDSSPVEIFLQAASHAHDLAVQTAKLHGSAVDSSIKEMV